MSPRTALLLLILAACGTGGPADEPAAEPRVYQVRGTVYQLPDATAGRDLMIRHEAIPEFRDADDKEVGMESMVMPFPVADPELLTGLEAGDRITFEFEVRWNEGYPLEITRLEKLPPETRLDFEASPEDPG